MFWKAYKAYKKSDDKYTNHQIFCLIEGGGGVITEIGTVAVWYGTY